METDAGERTINKLLRMNAEKTAAYKRLYGASRAAHDALKKSAENCFGESISVRKDTISASAESLFDAEDRSQPACIWSFNSVEGNVSLLVSLDSCGIQNAASGFLGEKSGKDAQTQDGVNEISEIEKRLAQIFVVEFVESFEELSDRDTVLIKSGKLSATRLGAPCASDLLANTKYAVVSFSLFADGQTCVAKVALYIHADRFAEPTDAICSNKPADWSARRQEAMMAIPLRLTANLAGKNIGLSSLKRIKTGEVIELEHASLDQVLLHQERGEGAPIMSGSLVSSGKCRALTRLRLNQG